MLPYDGAMGRKLILVIGLGAGYILGARAGRGPYERIAAAADSLWQSPRVAKARAEVEAYARQQAPIIAERAEAAAKAAPGVIKDAADKTATLAKDVADKTSATAKDVADKAGSTAKDLADRTTVIAKDVAGRTTVIAKDTAARVTGGPMPDPDSVVGPLDS